MADGAKDGNRKQEREENLKLKQGRVEWRVLLLSLNSDFLSKIEQEYEAVQVVSGGWGWGDGVRGDGDVTAPPSLH